MVVIPIESKLYEVNNRYWVFKCEDKKNYSWLLLTQIKCYTNLIIIINIMKMHNILPTCIYIQEINFKIFITLFRYSE